MEHCKYCNDKESENDFGRQFFTPLHSGVHPMATTLDDVDVCISKDDRGYFLHYEDDYGDIMIDIKCNYCPSCGRKLQERTEE